MVTIVFGNLISAFVLVYASQSILWIFLTLLCLVAAIFFLFLKPPRPPLKEEKAKLRAAIEEPKVENTDDGDLDRGQSVISLGGKDQALS